MKLSNIYKATFIITVTLLASCGFHMRGTALFPKDITQVAIISTLSEQSLANDIASKLMAKDISVITDKHGASNVYTLEIQDTSINESIVAYNQNSIPERMAITMAITYAIISPDGNKLFSSSLTQREEVSVTPENPVIQSSEREQA